jgi:RimJ/RimL family protein N-acetyltransferase
MEIKPVVLKGQIVRLEPLQLAHSEALVQTGAEASTWAYMSENPTRSAQAMQTWIAKTLREQEAGTCLPFVIVEQQTGNILGSTRYMDISKENRRLEIGWTWLAAQVRRTGVNTECKYLLLRHAFEHLGAIRVQLKTDSRNLRSQQAIERIGASKEGVLRNHMIMPDGYYRDSVYYSIIEEEWPHMQTHLEQLLHKY